MKIPSLELCVHKGDHAYDLLSKHFPIGNDSRRYLNENDDVSIFSFFSFPILKLSKNDMKRIAVEKGFLNILEKHGSVINLGLIDHAETRLNFAYVTTNFSYQQSCGQKHSLTQR